jgi:hypothetical protein
MLGDARNDVDALRSRYVAKVRELTRIRDEMLQARELLQWTASYPNRVESYGFQTAISLGLREPVRRTLQTDARIEYAAVIAALEEDARSLAEELGPQAKQALGVADPRTPADTAMWTSDERHQKWAREQLERARGLAEYGDPGTLADEVRDIRP